MTIELTRTHVVPKPWGVVELPAWIKARTDGEATGEIWYDRPGLSPDQSTDEPDLLLKLLFTSQPLSIQVHPGDAYAQAMGLANGKTEAWYVLSAQPHSKVALGLSRSVSKLQLRQAIEDGSIKDLVAWKTVTAGQVIFVPAGTIHAIGAGLVIAEVQQRSDTTFRLYDYGRPRELHIEQALDVADREPAKMDNAPSASAGIWTLLCTNRFFSLSRIELPPGASWQLDAEQETWALVLRGSALADSYRMDPGEAIFAQHQPVGLRAGDSGLSALVATSKAGASVAANVRADYPLGAGDREIGAERRASPKPSDVAQPRARHSRPRLARP